MFAARHPDLFSAAASLSGAVDSNLNPQSQVLSASPTFQGGEVDAIYGPRATQEVRWHGHNPTDLADNLRGLDLQVRSANGVPNPGIGEDPTSADTVSCVVEAGVYQASVSFHDTLTPLNMPHLWKDYGPGCHTVANFERELTDTFDVFAKDFAHPTPPPPSFDYKSIEPSFDVWDWSFRADPDRALEFMQLNDVNDRGLTVGWLRHDERHDAADLPRRQAGRPRQRRGSHREAGRRRAPQLHRRPRRAQRPAAVHAGGHHQRDHPERELRAARRRQGHPHPRDPPPGAGLRQGPRRNGHRAHAPDRRPQAGSEARAKVTLAAKPTCRSLRRTRRGVDRAKLKITGRDEFAHPVSRSRKVHLPVH